MSKYVITLENSAGPLDTVSVEVNDDPELTEAVVDFISEMTLRGGDTIRIREVE